MLLSAVPSPWGRGGDRRLGQPARVVARVRAHAAGLAGSRRWASSCCRTSAMCSPTARRCSLRASRRLSLLIDRPPGRRRLRADHCRSAASRSTATRCGRFAAAAAKRAGRCSRWASSSTPLLAPAACVCAFVLLLESRRASLALTLPWVFAVPPGFALGVVGNKTAHPATTSNARTVASGAGSESCSRARRSCARVVTAPAGSRWRSSAWHSAGPRRSPAWPSRCGASAWSCRCPRWSSPTPPAMPPAGARCRSAAPASPRCCSRRAIAVHVNAAHALLSVVAYRLVNFLAPVLPGLFAHSSLAPLLDEHAARERAGRQGALRPRLALGHDPGRARPRAPAALSRAASSSVRPLSTERGCSATTSDPRSRCRRGA